MLNLVLKQSKKIERWKQIGDFSGKRKDGKGDRGIKTCNDGKHDQSI